MGILNAIFFFKKKLDHFIFFQKEEQILNSLAYSMKDTLNVSYRAMDGEVHTINLIYMYKKTSPTEINVNRFTVEDILALCSTNPDQYNHLSWQNYETRWGVYTTLFHRSRKRLAGIEEAVIKRIEGPTL